jgi:hypothetical protein
MNVGEYGVAFLFSTGFDMSAFTGIAINFTKPDHSTLVVTDPDVSVPNVDAVTTLGTFAANTYAKYYFVSGDVDQAGEWSAFVTYDNAGASPPEHLISDTTKFTIYTGT